MSLIRRRHKGPNCVFLDGVNDFIFVSLDWNYTGPVTVEYSTLVKTADVKESTIIQFGQSASTTNRFLVHSPFSDKNLYFDYGNSDTGRISTSFSPFLDSWADIKLYSGGLNGDKKEIIINGAVANSAAGAYAPESALSGLEIGRYSTGGGGKLFTGAVRDLKIWQGNLLVLDMPLRVNFRDYTGNNYTITPHGDPKFKNL